MAEHTRVDSQKIMLHPEWLARWQDGRDNWSRAKTIYPLQVEISASGACNQRCTFCALDFVGYRPSFLPLGILQQAFKQMSRGGVKSVMFGGEGEATLHPELAEIIGAAKESGLDVGLTTNGSLMSRKFLQKCLKDICWIKVSLDAGRKQTYQKIHRPKNPSDWEEIFDNLQFAVKLKKKNNYQCRIGAQLLLLPPAGDENGKIIPGNAKEAVILAEKLKHIGLTYFVVKPYSHHPLSLTKVYKNLAYRDNLALETALSKIASPNFEIVFRSRSMQKYSLPRHYQKCLAIPFAWTYIMADGSVRGCSVHLADKRFYLGNINEQSFKEIWQGRRRQKLWRLMKNFKPDNCRKNCIMDRVNEHLWEIANPPYNVNFI